MRKLAIVVCSLGGALSGSCTGGGPGNSDASSSTVTSGGSLAGTWTLTTNGGSSAVVTAVAIGQDSLNVTSPSFTLTAVRNGNALTFTDEGNPGDPTNASVLTATQTPSPFNAGIVPFNLGGSWTMQAGPNGGSSSVTCTLSVSPSEIDGACQQVSPAGPWFSFTMKNMSAAASSFGDFGGHWINTWVTPGSSGGTFPCSIDFTGNKITTCSGGAVNGEIHGSPLAGITATYDGANALSGSAMGWAEFSATR